MKEKLFTRNPISLDLGLLILRLIMGAAIITHGWPKFQKVIQGDFQFADPVGLGPEISLVLSAFAEFICGLLIILGLATRWASLALIINMSVAFFIVHSADDFGTKEKSLLFLAGFLTVFLTGPGKYSADQSLSK